MHAAQRLKEFFSGVVILFSFFLALAIIGQGVSHASAKSLFNDPTPGGMCRCMGCFCILNPYFQKVETEGAAFRESMLQTLSPTQVAAVLAAANTTETKSSTDKTSNTPTNSSNSTETKSSSEKTSSSPTNSSNSSETTSSSDKSSNAPINSSASESDDSDTSTSPTSNQNSTRNKDKSEPTNSVSNRNQIDNEAAAKNADEASRNAANEAANQRELTKKYTDEAARERARGNRAKADQATANARNAEKKAMEQENLAKRYSAEAQKAKGGARDSYPYTSTTSFTSDRTQQLRAYIPEEVAKVLSGLSGYIGTSNYFHGVDPNDPRFKAYFEKEGMKALEEKMEPLFERMQRYLEEHPPEEYLEEHLPKDWDDPFAPK